MQRRARVGRVKRPADTDRPPALRLIGTPEQIAAIVPVLEQVVELGRVGQEPSDRTEGLVRFYADVLAVRGRGGGYSAGPTSQAES